MCVHYFLPSPPPSPFSPSLFLLYRNSIFIIFPVVQAEEESWRRNDNTFAALSGADPDSTPTTTTTTTATTTSTTTSTTSDDASSAPASWEEIETTPSTETT